MYESRINETIVNSDIALKNRLYVSGWLLSGALVNARDDPTNKLVLLHYIDDVPVGVIYARYVNSVNSVNLVNVQVFVRKSKRNLGIGSALVNNVKELSPNAKFTWNCGTIGSRYFWSKQFEVTI